MSTEAVSQFEPTVIGAFRRYWRFVCTVVIVLVIPVGLYVSTRPAVYTAKASLIVSDPSGPGVLGGQNPADPSRYVADQLAVFTSANLANQSSARAKTLKPPLDEPPSWFLAHVSASGSATNNNVISVAVKGSSAAQAKAAADAVVTAYSDVVKQSMAAQASAIREQLDTSTASIDKALAQLTGHTDAASLAQIQQLIANRSPLDARRAQVASEALHPSAGISFVLLPNGAQSTGKSAAARSLLLAIVVGALLGLAVAYARAYRNRVFSHNGDPESVLGAPLLIDVSTLPLVDILGRAAPKERQVSRLAQLFGVLGSFIADEVRGREGSGMSIAFVSPEGGAASTAVAWRTALALSAQGLKVLLVDADGSWQPTPRWLESAAERVEWVERLDGTIDLVDLTWTTERPVCFAGKPPEVRFPTSMSDVFREVEKRCDVVLIVTPRFLDSSSAAVLTAAAGRAIVVASEEGSVTNAQELARRLRLSDAVTLGYVYGGRRTLLERSQPPAPAEAQEPQVREERPLHEERPAARPERPAMRPERPSVRPERPSVRPERPVRTGPQGVPDEGRKDAPVSGGVSARWPRPAGAQDEKRDESQVSSARWPNGPRATPS
jgi:Mrp family chromosome partitioning ATPase